MKLPAVNIYFCLSYYQVHGPAPPVLASAWMTSSGNSWSSIQKPWKRTLNDSSFKQVYP